MPHRFVGHRLPPKLYAYPFDHVVGVTLAAAGIAINLFPATTPTSIMLLPWWAILAFRAMCLAGGVLIFMGLTKGEHRWSFTSEMAGMFLAAGVFGTYSLGLLPTLASRPGGALAFIIVTAWSLGCLIRARAIQIESSLRLKLFIQAAEIQRSKDS